MNSFEQKTEHKDIEIFIAKNYINYSDSLEMMKTLRDDIFIEKEKEKIFILEHENVYTCGSSDIQKKDILIKDKKDIIHSGRGGKLTYHCKGQCIIYFLINLKKRQTIIDLHRFVFLIEELIINALNKIHINSFRIENKIGIWIKRNDVYYKIAFIGLEIKKKISSHGLSINIDNDLSGFNKIIPCGIEKCNIISAKDLNNEVSIEQFNKLLIPSIIEFIDKLSL